MTKRDTFDCRKVNDFLVAYLDKRLDEELRTRFEAHIGRCHECERYLDQYNETLRFVHEAGSVPDDPPEELIERTIDFLRRHGGLRQGSGS